MRDSARNEIYSQGSLFPLLIKQFAVLYYR